MLLPSLGPLIRIAPLIPYRVRGVIWYQGERNARNEASAKLYRHQLPLLIGDWRQRWGQGSFPFLWVQLPNFKERTTEAGKASAWAVMRESMLLCLDVANTGMATTIDVGIAKNIHPENKQAVGDRLARWALAKVYDKDVVPSGPLPRGFEIDGRRIVVSFRHAHGGLKTRDDAPLKGFAIADTGHRWHWSQATIEGDTVVVWSPEIAAPSAVRYAWADNPDCNLVNGAGLPASPFRMGSR